MIQSSINASIIESLHHVETEHQVKILMSIESGSRAWGFESKDSDYDIRFIYVHPRDWYLSIDPGRDMIEYPIQNLIDMNGWDLKKALTLLYVSNPTLMEWIYSPIVYFEDLNFKQEIKALSTQYFSVKKAFYHYYSMAFSNYQNYLQKDRIAYKKYLYTLRPIFACFWLLEQKSQPPILFQNLMESVNTDKNIQIEIENLLTLKKHSDEKDSMPPIKALMDFIEKELQWLGLQADKIITERNLSTEPLNECLRKYL